jgi:Na+/glutamate symporter
MTIEVEVEGAGAIAATTELFALSEIEGEWETAPPEREAVIATIGTIVGLVGGSIAIAEQIRKWYQEYRQGKNGKKIDKVLLVGQNGQRIVLENATIEEIKQLLDS